MFDSLCTDKLSGTGLGLVICRDIVDKRNGLISVNSQLGIGTSFTVCVPLAASDLGINNLFDLPTGETVTNAVL